MRRLVDSVIAGVLLCALSPVMAVVAILVRWRLGRPILHVQYRAGRYGRPFALYKFRTMTDERDRSGTLLPDQLRMTSFGRRLRALSLDELPELWNVLRGDMALVGPRPLPVRYLERYSAEQHRRHEVRPGLTGWAQVNGRNALNWDDRLALDVWYVDHRTLWLDLRVLWRTLGVVLSRQGVNADGHATMPEFKGPGEAG